jgi:hypothetical protein
MFLCHFVLMAGPPVVMSLDVTRRGRQPSQRLCYAQVQAQILNFASPQQQVRQWADDIGIDHDQLAEGLSSEQPSLLNTTKFALLACGCKAGTTPQAFAPWFDAVPSAVVLCLMALGLVALLYWSRIKVLLARVASVRPFGALLNARQRDPSMWRWETSSAYRAFQQIRWCALVGYTGMAGMAMAVHLELDRNASLIAAAMLGGAGTWALCVGLLAMAAEALDFHPPSGLAGELLSVAVASHRALAPRNWLRRDKFQLFFVSLKLVASSASVVIGCALLVLCWALSHPWVEPAAVYDRHGYVFGPLHRHLGHAWLAWTVIALAVASFISLVIAGLFSVTGLPAGTERIVMTCSMVFFLGMISLPLVMVVSEYCKCHTDTRSMDCIRGLQDPRMAACAGLELAHMVTLFATEGSNVWASNNYRGMIPTWWSTTYNSPARFQERTMAVAVLVSSAAFKAGVARYARRTRMRKR